MLVDAINGMNVGVMPEPHRAFGYPMSKFVLGRPGVDLFVVFAV